MITIVIVCGLGVLFSGIIYATTRTRRDDIMEKAWAEKEAGNFGHAEELYTQALGEGQNNWIIYYYRGICRIKIDDTAGAQTDLETAIALDPKYSGKAQEELDKLIQHKE